MKLVMVVYDTGAESLVEDALDFVGATGWTRLTDVIGHGRAGRRMGDPIFPGNNNEKGAAAADAAAAPFH